MYKDKFVRKTINLKKEVSENIVTASKIIGITQGDIIGKLIDNYLDCLLMEEYEKTLDELKKNHLNNKKRRSKRKEKKSEVEA